MFPVELIPELRDHIVSFLGPWDEIASFSLTCHQAVETIEAYSQRELDRIESEHSVDDTWRFRVAAQDAATRLLEEGEDWQGVLPNTVVSHRRMLRSAYRTHLYTLGTTTHPRDRTSLLAVSMHPSGKYLLSGGHGGAGCRSVRLWDLSTKQCIKSFIGHDSSVDNVGFSAGHVVSSSMRDRQLRIWSMDGVCKHVLSLPEGHAVCTIAVSNDMVYAMGAKSPVYAINTIAGAMSSMEEPPWGDRRAHNVDLQVCKNYLLCMRTRNNDYYDNEPAQVQNGLGIYVFDRDSMDVLSHLSGNYCSMASTSEGNVALNTFHGQMQVYQLRDGRLVPRLSVSYPVHGDPELSIAILHMTKSRVFMKDYSLDGKRESKIDCSTLSIQWTVRQALRTFRGRWLPMKRKSLSALMLDLDLEHVIRSKRIFCNSSADLDARPGIP